MLRNSILLRNDYSKQPQDVVMLKRVATDSADAKLKRDSKGYL